VPLTSEEIKKEEEKALRSICACCTITNNGHEGSGLVGGDSDLRVLVLPTHFVGNCGGVVVVVVGGE
jgi:hypothetical protein